MPANEFEKQVQNRLDDFQLTPSAFVWKNVESQIRKKRKRRFVLFFILPVALGLLGYSIYYYVNPGQPTEVAQQSAPAGNKDNSSKKNETTIETKQQTDHSTAGTNPTEKDFGGTASAKTNTDNSIKSPAETNASRSSNQTDVKTITVINNENTIVPKESKVVKRNVKAPGNKSRFDRSNVSIDNRPEKLKQAQKEPVLTEKKIGAVKADNSPVLNNIKAKDETNVKSDPPRSPGDAKDKQADVQVIPADTKKDVPAESKQLPVPKVDSAKAAAELAKSIVENKPAKKKSSNSKIKWGFDVSAGLTSSEKRAFSLLKSAQADAVYANNPVASASPFPGAARTLPPSSVKAGAGFKAALVGELQMSKRSRVSIGIQYQYASNKIRTGTADQVLRNQNTNSYATTAGQVYRGPQTHNYTNSFHFAAVPVAYHFQLNKSEKVGIRWNIGLTPSYLVSSNALVYSTSNGGSYYHDESALNKFHFAIGTGLSLRLQNKKGKELVVGPEISFDTKKVMSDASQKQQYMMYGGLGARVLFPVKKK